MSDQGDSDKWFLEAGERLKKEGYAAGWRDALVAVNKALSQLGEGIVLPDKITPGTFNTAKNPPSGAGIPKQGTTPHAVLVAVTNTPGMTGGQIVEALRTSGHAASAPSISTSIQRLKGRKLIVLRHGKWYAE
jgi:hypothetical protein